MSPPCCFLTNLAIAVLIDSPVIDKSFLFYRLASTKLWELRTGSAQAQITIERLKEYEVVIPPLSTQHRISGILSAYDDLIENNLRRIRILEEMARAIYREWFVDFRFPGHENVLRVESPLGAIPKGWGIKRLGELAEEMRRNIPKGALRESCPHVGLEHIPRRSLPLDAWETTSSIGSNKLAFEKGEVLFGKIRPYFHKVSVAPFDGLCSADTIVIRPRCADYYGLVVSCVSSDEFVAHAAATSGGSKMPRASWAVLANYPLLVPNGDTAALFSRIFRRMVTQQQTLIFQIQTLRRTRDLLLSRLLSGTIDISDSDVTGLPTGEMGPPHAFVAEDQKHSEIISHSTRHSHSSKAALPMAADVEKSSKRSAVEKADNQLKFGYDQRLPIDQTDRSDVLLVIRQVFSDDQPRTRENAIRDVARALGYGRVGQRIRDILHTDLLTASRRGILENVGGELRLAAHSIAEYDRDFLKQQFLSSIGRSWIEREDAIHEFRKWMGFSRTGPVIDETARSLINGLLRESRLEADGPGLIRRRA
jgi:type I restriction enzyme S subunit